MPRTAESLSFDSIVAAHLGKIAQTDRAVIAHMRSSQAAVNKAELTLRGELLAKWNPNLWLSKLHPFEVDTMLATRANLPIAQLALGANLAEVAGFKPSSPDPEHGPINSFEVATALGDFAAKIDDFSKEDWKRLLMVGAENRRVLNEATSNPASPFFGEYPLKNHLNAAVSMAFEKAAQIAFLMKMGNGVSEIGAIQAGNLTKYTALEILNQEQLEKGGYDFPYKGLFAQKVVQPEVKETIPEPVLIASDEKSGLFAALLNRRFMGTVAASALLAGIAGQVTPVEALNLVDTTRRDFWEDAYETVAEEADEVAKRYAKDPTHDNAVAVTRILEERDHAGRVADARGAEVRAEYDKLRIGVSALATPAFMVVLQSGLICLELLRQRKNQVTKQSRR